MNLLMPIFIAIFVGKHVLVAIFGESSCVIVLCFMLY